MRSIANYLFLYISNEKNKKMRKKSAERIMVIIAIIAIVCSCTKQDDWTWENGDSPIIPGQSGDASDGIEGTLLDFDILINESDLSGDDAEEFIITDKNADGYDDFIENSTFSKVVSIYYNGSSITVDNEIEGITIENDGAHVIVNSTVKEVEYKLSGTTTDGSFKMYSSNK